jgi:hypothetical protein
MIAVGYLIGLRNIENPANKIKIEPKKKPSIKLLIKSFLPIIITVALTVFLNMDIAISTLVGVVTIWLITKTKKSVLLSTLKHRAVLEVSLAAFGAMLLKNATIESEVSENLSNIRANANMPTIILFSVIPALFAFITGSTPGAIALSIPILAETVTFIPKSSSLLFISSYLGYLIAPTHLCLIFTAHYFNSPISSSFKYLIPATLASMITALLTYLII